MQARTILAIIPIFQQMAPIPLPAGPPETYPIVYASLPKNIAKAKEAWITGLYNPPIAIKASAVAIFSTKLR
jgi:hypothetical protein